MEILTKEERTLACALQAMGIYLTVEEVMRVQALMMHPHLEDMTMEGASILKKSIHEAYKKRKQQCK